MLRNGRNHEDEGTGMNRSVIGIVVGVLLVVILVWLVSGGNISCHESFWDKDKQVIEIDHN
jgi:heme/copper-type cytochrome/quinol oxidase subunit 4